MGHLLPQAAVLVAVATLRRCLAGQVGAHQLGIQVHRDHHVGAERPRRRHRHRVDQAAVQHPAPLVLQGREQPGQRAGGAGGVQHRPLADPHFAAAFHVRGDGDEPLFQVFDIGVAVQLLEKAEQLFPLHHPAGESEIHQSEDVLGGQGAHPVTELLQRAADVGPAHQGADGGARHHVDFDAALFQRLNNADVRPSPGGPAAQRQPHPGTGGQ